MSLQVKLIYFSSLNKLFEDGDILLWVEFIFNRVLPRRNKANGFIDSLDLLYPLHTVTYPLPDLLYSLILLLGLLCYGVVYLHKRLLQFV